MYVCVEWNVIWAIWRERENVRLGAIDDENVIMNIKIENTYTFIHTEAYML